MRHRFPIVVLLIALVAVAAVRHPTASIRVLTHDAGDPAPARVQAAVDLGLVGLSVLVTWSRHLAR